MTKKKTIRILGIETSCDETSIAILEIWAKEVKVKKHIIYSQVEEHRKFGGVVPEKAARRHLEVLPHILKASRINFADIDYIAVTVGPGLVTSLMVGLDIAKTLSWKHSIPLIPVNHVYGHLLASELPDRIPGGLIKKIKLPSLGLVVSGGHTELVMLNKKWEAKIIGRTRDDAAGEAFDKVARLIGLSYPGGPEIETLAKDGNNQTYLLPRPMSEHHDTYDYSFSGLKNAMRLLVGNKRFTRKQKANVCASFQKAVIDSLIIKFEKSIKAYKPKSILLGGGVANNLLLRKEVKALARRNTIDAYLAPKKYTGDNAVMVAWVGWHTKDKALLPKEFSKLKADPQLSYT